MFFIQEIYQGRKNKGYAQFANDAQRKGHSKESNAFSASKRAIVAVISQEILWSTEKTVLMFSDVERWGTNPIAQGK